MRKFSLLVAVVLFIGCCEVVPPLKEAVENNTETATEPNGIVNPNH